MTVPAPPTIVLYTLPGCPYCHRARAILSERGLAFDDVDVRGIPEFRRELAECFGASTVPQIVIDGEPIGGSDQLARLARLGVLDALAVGREFPIGYRQRSPSMLAIVHWLVARLQGNRHTPNPGRLTVWLDRSGRVVKTSRE